MAPAVQAGSLATIIDLADDPPARLQHGLLQDVQQPLTLYIARVPGSRDIFLTTLKPQQKVVTASDVQSSLYYVHVDSVEDYKLLQSRESEEDGPVEDTAPYPPLSKQTSVRRKPLLPSRSLGTGGPPEPPSEIYPHSQAQKSNFNGHTKAVRKPVGSSNTASSRSSESAPPLPERKVLGPRPINQRFSATEIPVLQAVPERQNIDLRRWSEQPPAIPPRPPLRPHSEVPNGFQSTRLVEEDSLLRAEAALVNHGSTAEHCWAWEKDWQNKRTSQATVEDKSIYDLDEELGQGFTDSSLSLIRRYGAQQWNVGQIINHGIANSCAYISVDITTPGYAKFNDPSFTGNNELGTDSQTLHKTSFPSEARSDSSSTSRADRAVFTRHLQLSGFAKRPDRSPRSDSTEFVVTHRAGSSLDSQRRSQQSPDSPGSIADGVSEHKKRSSRGNVFHSPWAGVCEFTTGIAGRSVKCKHSYASSNTNFGPGMHSTTVSELRFNLPSSQAFGTPAPKTLTPGTPREAKRSSIFSSHHKQRSSTSFVTAEPMRNDYFGSRVQFEDRLDLSLGQEHAGGGFGGKQAKLGKLIIENEGFQMMDLIVAANMALWWRVYEKLT